MASIKSASNNSAATGTAVSVTAPAGVAPGDAVIISVHANNNTTIVDNNGATPFTTDLAAYSPNTVSGETVAVFSRVIQAGDPGTYNFTIGTSGRWAIIAIAVANPAASLYDVSPSTGNAANRDDSTASTLNAPTISTNTANAIHVVCGYSDDGAGGAMSPPSGYATQGTPTNEPAIVATKYITAAGATGAQTVTASTGSPMIALSFAIKNSLGLETKTGQFTQPTATNATFKVTGVGFVPKAILIFFNDKTADGSAAASSMGRGMAVDSTHRIALFTGNTDGASQADPRRQDDSKLITVLNSSGTVLVEADLVSLDNDGFTLNFSTVDAVARKINYVALGGTDLTNVFLKQITLDASTGNHAVTGVGFKPDAMIVLHIRSGGTPPITDASPAGGNQGWGFVTAAANNAYGADYHDQRQVLGDMYYAPTGGGTNTTRFDATLVSFDSDGFTYNQTNQAGTRQVWCLCLKGGQYKVGNFSQKTSTGAQATTGIGFQPTGLLLFSGNDTSEANVQTSYERFSVGAGNSSASRASIWESVDTAHADQNLDSANIIKMMTAAAAGAPTTQAAADLTSLDSDGFTLNWGTADATAREIVYMAFGNAAAVVASTSPAMSRMLLGGVGM